MRDHRIAKTPLPDPALDLLSAETFRRAAGALYLDTIGTSAPAPAWLTVEAENQRYDAAETLRESAATSRGEEAAEKALRLARRVRQCGESLAILEHLTTADLLPIALRCDSRWCPPCAVSKCYTRAFAIMRSHAKAARAGRLIHAVYTCPNVRLDQLRDTCKALRRAMRIATGQAGGHAEPLPSFAPIAGAITNLEVTYNEARDDWHPHIHALITSPRLDQRAHSWDWSVAMAKAGLPAIETLVFLSALRGRRQATTAARGAAPASDLLSAAFEVSKYACKPASYHGDGAPLTRDLAALALALRGLRMSDASGESRALLAEDAGTHVTHYAWEGSLRQYSRDATTEQRQSVAAAIATNHTARTIQARYYK